MNPIERFPLSFRAIHLIFSTYKNHQEDDMVRVFTIDTDGSVQRGNACFMTGHEANHVANLDIALCDALVDVGAMWYDTEPMQTTEYYSDAHGTWCLGCGNEVYDAIDEAYPPLVCANERCKKFAPSRLQDWLKKRRNIA